MHARYSTEIVSCYVVFATQFDQILQTRDQVYLAHLYVSLHVAYIRVV